MRTLNQIMSEVGQSVTRRRKELGYESIEAFCDVSSIPVSVMTCIEFGGSGVPLESFLYVLDALDTDLVSFLDDYHDKPISYGYNLKEVKKK